MTKFRDLRNYIDCVTELSAEDEDPAVLARLTFGAKDNLPSRS